MDLPPGKKERLVSALQELGPLCVAFSGGVDSALLCAMAKIALGDRVLAVTVVSKLMPKREQKAARAVAAEIEVAHVEVSQDDLDNPEIAANRQDRCYFCKKSHLAAIAAHAKQAGFETLALGANTDDESDFRPGLVAAREAGAVSPLLDAGLCKAEIRELARMIGLSVWDKPSAACLASRVPYGTRLTPEILAAVELAEDFLFSLGLSGFRVRHFGPVAVMEVSAGDFPRFSEKKFREQVEDGICRAGFSRVAIDIAGYRQGSMNQCRK